MTATTFLRPVHAWFDLWDAVAGPVARLVAVVVGAGAAAGALVLVGVAWPIALAVAILAWVGLAVAEEHDRRALLPVDAAFAEALSSAVAGPPLGLAVRSARGPSRVRPGEPDHFELVADDDRADHPFARWYIVVERDPDGRWMRLGADLDSGTSDAAIDETWTDRDDPPGGRATRDADAVAAALRRRTG